MTSHINKVLFLSFFFTVFVASAQQAFTFISNAHTTLLQQTSKNELNPESFISPQQVIDSQIVIPRTIKKTVCFDGDEFLLHRTDFLLNHFTNDTPAFLSCYVLPSIFSAEEMLFDRLFNSNMHPDHLVHCFEIIPDIGNLCIGIKQIQDPTENEELHYYRLYFIKNNLLFLLSSNIPSTDLLLLAKNVNEKFKMEALDNRPQELRTAILRNPVQIKKYKTKYTLTSFPKKHKNFTFTFFTLKPEYTTNLIPSISLHLKNNQNDKIYYPHFICTTSQDNAQKTLMNMLSINTNSVEEILVKYTSSNQVGDFCIMSKKKELNLLIDSDDIQKLFFVRNNIVVSLSSRDIEADLIPIAKKIDRMLMNQNHTPD